MYIFRERGRKNGAKKQKITAFVNNNQRVKKTVSRSSHTL